MKQIVEEAAKEARIASAETLTTYGTHSSLDDFTYLSHDEIAEAAFIKGAEWQSKQSSWISIKEQLPQPNEEVLLFDKGSIRHYVIGWLRKEKGCSNSCWALSNGYVADEDITHWMPIPPFDQITKPTKSFDK